MQGLWPVLDRIIWPIPGIQTSPLKTYGDMTKCIVQMHHLYFDENSTEATQAVELVKFCPTMYVAGHKKMIQTLWAERVPTLFDWSHVSSMFLCCGVLHKYQGLQLAHQQPQHAQVEEAFETLRNWSS